MRETALRAAHESLGARLVPFAGWHMPVQYTGILDEAKAVRSRGGLFDLGHMGRVRVEGSDGEAFLQRLQTNDVTKIAPGGIRYSMILDDDGLTQDDILVYREPDDSGFFVVVNASNADHDLGIMAETAKGFGDVRVIDQTDELGMFAIQGPRSVDVTAKLTDVDVGGMKYYSWTHGEVAGTPVGISRTGYTGEDGFEVYVPQDRTAALFQAFLDAGRDADVVPCGLGSRDILRLEAGMALFGHEIDRTTNPLEAGLGWAVKFTHDFRGKAALETCRDGGGTGRKLVGLTTPSRRVPRQGYLLYAGDRQIGTICSGGASPTLGTNIATAYVSEDCAEPGTELQFAIRDQREAAVVAPLPFYKRPR
ncbi:MAG: glycine cleavage system aminomethyltransferase GcvT [Planctomycetota bacterium]